MLNFNANQKIMNKNELEGILRLHKLWLLDDKEGEQADLRGSDLSHANLSHANLLRANLTDANLSRADLSYADLSYSNLSRADLSYADLTNADLFGADLSYANLTNANLTYADLSYANLTNAKLTYADLSYANLTNANLTYADLRRSDLTDANLTKADLRGSDLTKANLKDAIFKSNKLSEQTKNPSYGENTMNFTVTKKSPSKIIKGYYDDINLFLRVADPILDHGKPEDESFQCKVTNSNKSAWIQYGKKLSNINVVFLDLKQRWEGYTAIYEDEIVTITL